MKMSTYHTPSILHSSELNSDNLILFGTASNKTVSDSLIIRTVVNMTIIENTKVHIGSAIFALGYRRKYSLITQIDLAIR